MNVTQHDFATGEKRLFTRRNDCCSLLLSLAVVMDWSRGNDDRRRGTTQEAEVARLSELLEGSYQEMEAAAEEGGLDIDHLTPPELRDSRLILTRRRSATVRDRLLKVEGGKEILAAHPGVLTFPAIPE